MCYHVLPMAATTSVASSRPAPIGRVGVRELRQNLSVYLERVVTGNRSGSTAAALWRCWCVAARATLVDRLIALGRAIPATRQQQDIRFECFSGLGARSRGAPGTSRIRANFLPAISFVRAHEADSA